MAKDHDDYYEDNPKFDVADELFDDSESKRDPNDDDYIFDEIKGSHGKKTVLSKLNQRNIGKHEMDDIFNDWS
jgi:hypothetical protein